jgi:hypothetical protein|tara:strand:- start:240 stop:692 length:453 start_codon:yes stop_codon:yes gene_type:complete
MAIDYKGQPITNQTAFTTTGIMNRKANMPAPLKMPTPKVEEKKPVEKKVTQGDSPVAMKPDLSNLRDDDKRILNIHLTPSLKTVLNKVFGGDLFPDLGIQESTVSVPVSRIVNRFGSVQSFMNMVQEQREGNNNVPPSQGLMTSPQTMKV